MGIRWLVLLSILLSAGPAAGAEVATRAGTKEILFRLQGLSDLGLSGYEGGLGLRTYLKDGLAFRPGVDFAWSRRRTRPDLLTPDQPDPGNSREIDTSVRLELALEKHLRAGRALSPYVGGCLYGLYRNDKTEPGVAPGSLPGTMTKVTAKETDGAALGLLGFEYGLGEGITLGGETRFGLTVTTGKREIESLQRPDRLVDDQAAFAVNFETAAIFLGIRW